MAPDQPGEHPLASLPNSLQSKLQRFDNLIAQGESALSQGDVELAKLLSLEARRLIAQAAPQIAALIELAHMGCRGYEMQTIETTDREQAVPKTFLGICFGSEIVNVRTTVTRTVRGRIL